MNELETKLAEVIEKLSEANELIYQARSIAQNKEVAMASSDSLLKKAVRASVTSYAGMGEISYMMLKHAGIEWTHGMAIRNEVPDSNVIRPSTK